MHVVWLLRPAVLCCKIFCAASILNYRKICDLVELKNCRLFLTIAHSDILQRKTDLNADSEAQWFVIGILGTLNSVLKMAVPSVFFQLGLSRTSAPSLRRSTPTLPWSGCSLGSYILAQILIVSARSSNLKDLKWCMSRYGTWM